MRIFISYSRHDREAAEHIAKALAQRGADVFIDYERMQAGDNFIGKLMAEVRRCDVMVVLISENSLASRWVRTEVQRAWQHEKHIIPVMLDGSTLTDDFGFLELVQHVDFTRWHTDRQVGMAMRPLAAALKLPERAETVPPEDAGHIETGQPAIATPKDITDILPPPFDWCEIPAGKVTLEAGGYVPEGGQTFPVERFWMAKYPVTNAQFQVFVDDSNGYANLSWWDYSDVAKSWRSRNTQPHDPAFGGIADHPRVHVAWYESVAFCRWLNALTQPSSGSDARDDHPSPLVGEGPGVRGIITLPTEQQWQRAAQGDDNRVYPWGNEWDCRRCNNRVSPCKNSGTTPVTQYEGRDKGNSPYDVVDMAGNVWEWCLTGFFEGNNNINRTEGRYVLRGGSWNYYNTVDFRVVVRGWNYPVSWGNFRGFRLALS